MNKRIIAIAAAAVILFSTILSVSPDSVKADTRTIHIKTASDLKELSNNCKLDSYSEGLIVELDCDIDLEFDPFTPIPTFKGTFHGNHHTISGFDCANDGSNQGFFRYIEEEGIVTYLNVEGSVKPDTGQCNIGGLVGTNYGTVRYCTFEGNVTGLINTGGIVGDNQGTIYACGMKGEVLGKQYTGGICGYNEGSIAGCSNEASVNIQIQSASIDLEKLSLIDLTNLDTVTASDSDTVMDTGGIVGGSVSVVKDCVNKGTVGYQHYGYNVGGIAGRQDGFLTGCENYGDVYGRKDVAGICGQMEPHLYLEDQESLTEELQALNDSISDAMNDLSGDANAMKGELSALQGQTDNATSAASAYEQYIKDLYNENNDSSEDSDDSSFGDTVKQGATDVSNTINGLDEETKDDILSGNVSEDTLDKVKDSAETNGGSTGSAAGSAADQIEKDAGSVSDSTIDDIKNGNVTSEDVEDITNAAENSAAAGAISSGIDRIEAKKAAEQAEADAEQQKKDEALAALESTLAEKVQTIGNALANMNDRLADITGSFADNMNNVNTQFAKVNRLLTRILTGDMTYYEDISELDTEDDVDGKVSYCTNYGYVDGDEDVGGIAGEMAIEKEYDADESVVTNSLAISGIVSKMYETRAVVRSCSNEAPVNARKNYAGGIVGKSDMGLIINNENYGDITSDAEYVGGIAGDSESLITGSYSMCNLDGEAYIGGIAGNAVQITDCLSMVSVADEHSSCSGAIAGYLDITAENSAVNNYYISDTLGAIDGISYAGKAEPITASELYAKEDLPDTFKNMVVTFTADGVTVKLVKVAYGKSISESDYPEVPAKEGYTGIWPEISTYRITSSMTVNAIYYPKQNSLETSMNRSDTDLPVLLVEGEFEGTASVSASEYEGEIPNGTQGQVLEALTITIKDGESDENSDEQTKSDGNSETSETSGSDETESTESSETTETTETTENADSDQTESDSGYQVRYLAPDKRTDVKLYRICEDGSLEKITYKVIGSYLSFHVPDSETTIVCTGSNIVNAAIIGIVCLAAAGILLLILLSKKKKGLKKEK